MARKQKPIKCKKCGFSFEIGSKHDNREKEWTMVAPMPDKDGNVTITLMATWKCPECGKTIRGSAGKTKGEFAGKSKKEQIEEMVAEEKEFNIKEFAESMGVEYENLTKILSVMIKKGTAKGKIKGDLFIPA